MIPWSQKRYDAWVKKGRPPGDMPKLYDHPKRIDGLSKHQAHNYTPYTHVSRTRFAPSCAGEYPRDALGRPVHPYAEAMLLAGFAIDGPGALWEYGPNLCADAIVLGVSSEDELKTIVIKRGDTGRTAFPGGFLDPWEDPKRAAIRELREETGIDMDTVASSIQFSEQIANIIVPDSRTTLHSWPETFAHAFLLKRGAIDKLRPKGSDDALAAKVQTIDEELLSIINPGHEGLLHTAIGWFEEVTGMQVCAGGKVDEDQ